MEKEQYSVAKEQATKPMEQGSVTQPAPKSQERPKPIYEVTTPSIQPVIEEPVVQEPPPVMKPVSFTPVELSEIKEQHPAETITAGEIEYKPFIRELVKQYSSIEDLRRAILHYEILGPPVSLREQI